MMGNNTQALARVATHPLTSSQEHTMSSTVRHCIDFLLLEDIRNRYAHNHDECQHTQNWNNWQRWYNLIWPLCVSINPFKTDIIKDERLTPTVNQVLRAHILTVCYTRIININSSTCSSAQGEKKTQWNLSSAATECESWLLTNLWHEYRSV